MWRRIERGIWLGLGSNKEEQGSRNKEDKNKLWEVKKDAKRIVSIPMYYELASLGGKGHDWFLSWWS